MKKTQENFNVCVEVALELMEKLLDSCPGDDFKFDLVKVGTGGDLPEEEISVPKKDFLQLISWAIEQTKGYTVPILIDFRGKRASEFAMIMALGIGTNFRNLLYSKRKAGFDFVPQFDCGWRGGPYSMYWTVVGFAGDDQPRKRFIVHLGEEKEDVAVVTLEDILGSKVSVKQD